MRKVTIILLCALLTSCTRDREPIQRLKDYEYPLDSLDHGKFFVFRQKSNGEYFYIEQRRITELGIDFIVQDTYSGGRRESTDKIAVAGNGKELVETYFYEYPDSSSEKYIKQKGEIYQWSNLYDGQKYRGTQVELGILTSSNIKGVTMSKEVFSRGEKQWVNGKTLDVLVFTSEMEVSAHAKYLPFLSNKTVYSGENVYAKGLGLVRYSRITKDETSEWELVDIKNVFE